MAMELVFYMGGKLYFVNFIYTFYKMEKKTMASHGCYLVDVSYHDYFSNNGDGEVIDVRNHAYFA